MVPLQELTGELQDDEEFQSLEVESTVTEYKAAIAGVKSVLKNVKPTKQAEWTQLVDSSREAIGTFSTQHSRLTEMLDAVRSIFTMYEEAADKKQRHSQRKQYVQADSSA